MHETICETKNHSHVSATGDYDRASATGDYSTATATGDHGVAVASGRRSTATATGDHGTATALGRQGLAVALGHGGCARAGKDGVVVLAYSGCDPFVAVGRIGEAGIKADTWYRCSDGRLVECYVPEEGDLNARSMKAIDAAKKWVTEYRRSKVT